LYVTLMKIIISVLVITISFIYYTNFYNLTEYGTTPVELSNDMNCTMCDVQFTKKLRFKTKGIIIYRDQMNIRVFGIQHFHPFDSEKYGRVFKFLKEAIPYEPYLRPKYVSYEQLKQIHTAEYLYHIQTSPKHIAEVTQLEILSKIPNFLLQRMLILPIRYAVGATIAASELISNFKVVLVLGGGFHHAYSQTGGGWCFFSDVILSIMNLSNRKGRKIRVLYIDLDAHTGNGVARDKFLLKHNMPYIADIYIIDMYNAYIYPGDYFAEQNIDQPVRLTPYTGDKNYLKKLKRALKKSENLFPNPDVIYYNAGSDILKGDPLGRLNITPQGFIQRDEMVFHHAQKIECPMIMVMSGGYQKTNARIITDSIINLHTKFKLF
jgi:histone deacetylase 11